MGEGTYLMQCSSNITVPKKPWGSCSNADFDLGDGPEAVHF